MEGSKRKASGSCKLDRRGIDLDSILCPSCTNTIESCAHSLVTCDLAMSVWEKVFSWWKVGSVYAFSIDEFFSSYGNVNIPVRISSLWQAVIWTTGFLALGWLLEEIHVTWAHLEKKQTRLRTYTKSLEDLCIQCVEMASQAKNDAAVMYLVTA
ncbi:hypothetical protein Tco_0007163 [Tanacetum coccineum]